MPLEEQRVIPVTHIITGLNTGGAEIMLYKLLRAIDLQRFPSNVISLTEIGEIGGQIQSLGIPVVALGMNPGRIKFTNITHLTREIREANPTVVQTWMYHADLLGGWSAKNAGKNFIAWNIRNSTLDWRKSKGTTLLTVWLCAVLSHFIPKRIVVCSQAASLIHQKIGYAKEKMKVIPNGFDLSIFKPDKEAGRKLRQELNLDPEISIVGLAARFDEQKDHQTFIKSAGIVLKTMPEVHFFLCGEGITSENHLLVQWLTETGAERNFHLLGRWTDMPEFHNACDVAVSASAYGESFSNVLGEAMACGVPCVSTRVGGAEEVLGETSRIVPPGDPLKLAEAILDILKLPENFRMELGQQSRQRMIENFDIFQIAEAYMDFWKELSNES
ncbi:MAG TPA: glycosyltransferase [Leptolinea sp.]